jgi:chaperonin GroES
MLTSKSKVRPIGKYLLVSPVPAADTMRGRIIVPETAKTKPLLGVVMAIGDGKTESKYVGEWPPSEIGIEKGTTVVFGRFDGTELPVDDLEEKDWPRLLHVDEIKGVLET